MAAPTPATRPAETSGVSGGLAVLIAYALGVRDAGVIVALTVVVGGLPALVTGLVVLYRQLRR